MNFQIRVPSPSDLDGLKENLAAVYRQAFRAPPYSKTEPEVAEFLENLPAYPREAGFRLVIAVDSVGDELVGFTMGRTATAGQPWHDIVQAALQPLDLEEWLINAYQIIEMAVVPSAQRKGVAGRLHDRLLQGRPEERALLTTIAGESPAYRFYLQRGWKELVGDLIVPSYPRTFRVMGLMLPLSGSPGARP